MLQVKLNAVHIVSSGLAVSVHASSMLSCGVISLILTNLMSIVGFQLLISKWVYLQVQ